MKRIVYTPLSREFLLNRGYCCNSGCSNCPYNYKKEIMKKYETRPHPNVEQIIAFNREQHLMDNGGPGVPMEKEDEPNNIPNRVTTFMEGLDVLKPFTEETIDTIIENGGDGSFDHYDSSSLYHYDDGVCDGVYTHPTQEEIIEHNRQPCRDYIGLSNYSEKMTLVPENLLEKLKDFDYWKEWKHK